MMTISLRGMLAIKPDLLQPIIDNCPRAELLPDYLSYVDPLPVIDADVLTSQIILTALPFEIAITDVDMLSYAIAVWAQKERWIWQELYETLCYRYTPYWNKDSITTDTGSEERTDSTTSEGGTQETITENGSTTENTDRRRHTEGNDNLEKTGTETERHSGTDTVTRNLTDSESGTERGTRDVTETETNTPLTTTTEKVAGFNSESLVNNAQTQITGTDTTQTITDEDTSTTFGKSISHTGTEGTTHGETITKTYDIDEDRTKTETETETGSKTGSSNGTTTKTGSSTGGTTGTGKTDRTGRIVEQGNIGVTATQDLIQAQRELVRFDIYQFIADRFKAQFCVLVY